MYMDSTTYEFNKMSTVTTTILSSFEATGINVNYCRSWGEEGGLNTPPFFLLCDAYEKSFPRSC